MTEARVFTLVGDPVDHSLSPVMHRAAFEALGLDARYDAVRVPADGTERLQPAIRRLAALGGGNVTVPHKVAAAGAVDCPSDLVRRLGSCNCFWEVHQGVVAGDNTDVKGIQAALASRLGGLRPKRGLILGAGGAAIAAGAALGRLGVGSVVVRNRTASRGRALAARLGDLGIVATIDTEGSAIGFDVVVNATSLGMHDGDPLPMPLERRTAGMVLDLVYHRTATRWLQAAGVAGIEAVDGREVLLQQGAACYPLWFGVEAPVETMRRALSDA